MRYCLSKSCLLGSLLVGSLVIAGCSPNKTVEKGTDNTIKTLETKVSDKAKDPPGGPIQKTAGPGLGKK